MAKFHYYVYHTEVFPSGRCIDIYEPFEFDSPKKALNHAHFFNQLSGISYKIVRSDEIAG